MPKVIKYSADSLGWQKKSGPLRVWRVVDGRKRTNDGKTLRVSIQEIPEDRYEDALDMMMTIFARDEPIFRCTKIIEDPIVMEDFRKLWSFSLQQGIAVGAFLVDDNNPKPPLVGVNITLVESEATERALHSVITLDSEITRKIMTLLHSLEAEKNPQDIYNVDKYMTALGLCVAPEYRGQGFAVELLNARKEMGPAYDLRATSTVFTALGAQLAAAKAGFELLIERNFADIKNDNGAEMFPGITSKSLKFMGLKLSH